MKSSIQNQESTFSVILQSTIFYSTVERKGELPEWSPDIEVLEFREFLQSQLIPPNL